MRVEKREKNTESGISQGIQPRKLNFNKRIRHDERTDLPESASNLPLSLLALFSFFLALYALRSYRSFDYTVAAMICIAACALPMAIGETFFLKAYRRASSGLVFDDTCRFDPALFRTRFLGFIATLVLVGGGYWIFPEYDGLFYRPFWHFLAAISIPTLAASIPYFVFTTRHLEDGRDGFWHLGTIISGGHRQADANVVVQHLLGWVVKAFFLPLMFVYLVQNVQFLCEFDFRSAGANFGRLFDFFWNLLFSIDLIYVCVGYIFTIRAMDSHIRSTEPTFFGWSVTLLCYQPFWSFFHDTYLTYDRGGGTWGQVFYPHPFFYFMWGSAILILIGIYALSTVTFGLRFSNLTNRGILTNGPYCFCKHPAYVSKNIAWWLISVPFISSAGIGDALRSCLLLFLLNLIYLLRAITEERHLSRDSDYVEYALTMNSKSIFRWIRPLRFKEPERS